MLRVIHFEIQSDNPRRASQFYQKVFGWKIQKIKGQDYWLVKTGLIDDPGIDGSVFGDSIDIENKTNGFICVVDVFDIERYLSLIKANGGKVIRPITKMKKVGLISYCQDPEKNLFAILEPDDFV